MLTTDLSKGFDEFLFGIPLIALLLFAFFRLDETFTAKPPHKDGEPPPQRNPKSLDPRRSTPMSDPDGRPWQPRSDREK